MENSTKLGAPFLLNSFFLFTNELFIVKFWWRSVRYVDQFFGKKYSLIVAE